MNRTDIIKRNWEDGLYLHPKGIEPLSQEPESYVISITLRVLTVYYYSIL